MAVQVRIAAITVLLALGIGAMPLPALAQMKLMMTVERYQKMIAAGEFGDALMGAYLHSLFAGLHQTHLHFTTRKEDRQKPIYCPPRDTVLVPKEINAELLREFATRPEFYKPDMPVGPIVLEILRRRFPCS